MPWCGPVGWTSGKASGATLVSDTHSKVIWTEEIPKYLNSFSRGTDKHKLSLNRYNVFWATFDGQLMSLWKKRTVSKSLQLLLFPRFLSGH